MFERFVAYEASAGSGKTFALSIRYISLLFLGVKPEKILTLTFTNKAANEMRERIENSVKNLDKKEYKNELKELCGVLGLSKEEVLKKRQKVLEEFLKRDIYILTIDKFCTMILRKFSLYIGLLPDFTIETKDDEERFVTLFIKRLQELSSYNDFIKFASYEKKKLNSILQILFFFYTKSVEVKCKKAPFSSCEKDIYSSLEELREYLNRCGTLSERAKKSLNMEDVKSLLSKSWICKDSLEEYRDFKKCYIKEADDSFEKLKEALKKYLRYQESRYLESLSKLLSIYIEVNYRLKRELNDMSFSDIANFTLKILNDEIERDFFYFRLDAKFDHILIDEFQDTSVVQYEILKPMFEEICSGAGTKELRSLFYVGDVKQSIYRFRGGDKELFYHVAKSYGLKVEKLNKNYRSKKVLVDFVNEVFRDKIKGYFDQEAKDEEGGYVKVTVCENPIEDIVKTVKILLEKGIRESDLAVLVYTNDEAAFLEESIKDEIEGVKVSTDTALLLKNNPQVKIVIGAMKYLYFKEEIYRVELLSLLGKDMDEDVELEGLSIFLKPNVFVKKMMDKFSLSDLAVFEFLQKSYGYKDLEEFLFGLEEFKDEVSFKELEGIKVLTIHKSKGLEFRHLLVCDRLKKQNTDRSSFIIEDENLKTKNVYMKAKNRECIDDEYKIAYDKEKSLQYEDGLNVKYVALTRAKESLFVFKKEKNSDFDDIGLKEYEKGKFPIPHEEIKKSAVGYDDFLYEDFKTGKQKNELSLESEDIKESDFKAIAFGNALHYMLEMMDGFEDDSLEYAFVATQNRYGDILSDEDMQDIRRRVLALLRDDFFNDLTEGKKIYKEIPLIFEGELKQLDLLLEDDFGYAVVDYKSSKYIQKEHKEQVLGYKKALKSIDADKEIKGYLCYLSDDEIRFVEV
ncbi:MAG: RecB-like helicase [Epsilonproteobacteria bacterium]|nr:RecB-like helicase [Campylobacterota bacterium]